ncbi:MAG TPA: hypothetical protein VLK65_20170 [Vicinamibacteria bacterium]|nr:hypothetical protein [Vicinamibacteria bacterium]
MAQTVSHYLVDWDFFTETWTREENPRDALEGAAYFSTSDPYVSGLLHFQECFSALAESAESEDDGELDIVSWWPDLEKVVRTLTGALDASGPRDLKDDYAYRDGGFAQTMKPGRVAALAKRFLEIDLEASRPWAREAGLEERLESLAKYYDERKRIFLRGAELGKGYVSRVG